VLYASSAVRAVLLLLAFGLGGLVAPAAHAWGHIGDIAPLSSAVGTPSVEGLGQHSALHECALCEVRLAASEMGVEAAQVSQRVADVPPKAHATPDLLALRSVFGRAPPTRG